MTPKQDAQYRALVANVQKTYWAMQANTDKSKSDKLKSQWVKATEKADAFLVKHV